MNIQKIIKSKKTLLMGIVNVTPDSFYDGNKFLDANKAVKQALKLTQQGADIIDIGGESSRPGAKPVPCSIELKRVLPVIRTIKNKNKKIIISLDTYKPAVATAGLEAGVDIINDITGCKNKQMRQIIAKYQCPVILMHMKGRPQNMQKNPLYKNCVQDIKQFFKKQIELCVKDGIKKNNIILDPGIGFGKKLKHNLAILNNLDKFKTFNLPLLIGASRKSFMADITGENDPNKRLAGSITTHVQSVLKGADIIRAHDIKEHQQAVMILKHLKF